MRIDVQATQLQTGETYRYVNYTALRAFVGEDKKYHVIGFLNVAIAKT